MISLQERNKAVYPLLVTVFLDLVGFGIVIPILAPLFLSDNGILGASYNHAQRTIMLGFLLATYPLAQFFGSPVLGGMSDRYGRKPLLIWTIAGNTIGNLVFAGAVFMQNIPLLFIARAISGITGGNISIAYSAMADLSTPETKAKNFGLVGMMFGLGFIIGPFLGGVLSDATVVSWFNFSVPFIVAALLSMVNILLIMFQFKETLVTRSIIKLDIFTGIRNIRKAFLLQDLRLILAVSFLYMFGFTFFTQFFQVYLIEKFHVTQGQIGMLFAFFGIWIALTQGLGTRIVAKRFLPQSVVRTTLIMLGLTMPLFLVPNQWIFIYAIVPLISIPQGLTFANMTALISNLAGRESQGEILGINNSIQSLAHAIPVMVAGFIAAIDIRLPIIASSICILLAAVLYIFSFERSKKEVFHEI